MPEILRRFAPQNDSVGMAAASCKYPISWQFANRSNHSSFSPQSRLRGVPLFVILNREAVKNLLRIKKRNPTGER